MKTTFTIKSLFFAITILFGLQTGFTQNAESQLVKYKSEPIDENNSALFDTIDVDILGAGVVAPNYMTPYSQLECFNFGVGFFYGAGANNIDYTTDLRIIDNSNGNEVFYDSINGIFISEPEYNLFECYSPSQYLTSYTGYYSVSISEYDPDLENNYDTIQFEISDQTFAKENGGSQIIVPDPSSWDFEEKHSWAFGNYFYIIDGDSWHGSTATFALGNANADGIPGRLITVYLYKWEEDSNEDGHMDPDERTKVAFSVYEILGTELPTDLITVPLWNYPSGEPCPINLESNQAYALMVEYSTLDQVDLALVASTNINYGHFIAISEIIDFPRYAGLLGINEKLDKEPYNSVGFGHHVVPVVRLNLDIINNASNPSLLDMQLNLSPNPADNILTVEIDFPENQKEASIKIYDLNGRLMKEENYKNIKYEKINFDLTKFAAGTYFLQFVTDAGVRTERFVVHHF